MTSVHDMKPTDRVKVFEALLSSPDMNEACKVVITPSRKTILILSRLVEWGIEKEGSQGYDEVLSFLPKESFSELQGMVAEMLKKGELVEFYERLKLL